jgi:hypothetical protein
MNTPDYSRSESAPYPTSDAVSRADESVAALRAGVVALPPYEAVGRGLLRSLLAVPVGVAASVLIWQWGFIASVTSFAIAAGAAWLYARGAGNPPRAGLLPLLGVIVLGVVLSFFAVVAADLVAFHATPEGAGLGWPSTTEFVLAHLFDPEVLGSHAADLVLFVLFAVLGAVGTVRRLLQARRA